MPSSTAAVIWLHDIKGAASEWYQMSDVIGKKMDYSSWTFPEAGEMFVSALGEQTNAWFDIPSLPIRPENVLDIVTTSADIKSLNCAIDSLHRTIDELVASGTDSSRILLGGFGQGGAVALLAALQCPHKLGGVAAFAGWVPAKIDVCHKANRGLEVLLLHGKDDEKVLPGTAEATRNVLANIGASIQLQYYNDLGHSIDVSSTEQLGAWMADRLPPLESTSSLQLEPEDDMSPEAAEVWRRLVVENEQEEAATRMHDHPSVGGEEEAYIPIDDTVVDLIESDPDACLLTHKYRPEGILQRAIYGCNAIVSYVGRRDGEVVQRLDKGSIVVGSQEVPDCVNRAVQFMTAGSRGEVKATPEYSYGKGTWEDDLLPEGVGLDPEAEAIFEIELHSCEGGDVAEADVIRATALKEEGNTLFKAGLYRRALHAYQLAKRDFDCLYSGSAEEVQTANAIRLPCILNIAACHQKLSQWSAAETACALALAIDDKCIKALFRRAQANREFGDLDAARAALRRIEELEPSNKAVAREQALVERAQKKHDKKAKGTYTKMFA